MMFLDCPAYLDRDTAARCGLPVEVSCRFTMHSTDGPIECGMIRCPAGHWFNGAIESLTWDSTDNHDPGAARPGSRAGRDSLQRRHGGRDVAPDRPCGTSLPSLNGIAAARTVLRPTIRAALWITAIRPLRAHHLRYRMEAAVTGGNPARDSSLPQQI